LLQEGVVTGLGPSKLQSQLDQARREYSAGNFTGSDRTLRAAIRDVEQWEQESGGRSIADYRLTLARAQTLLGRVLARQDRNEEAATAFDTAIRLFDEAFEGGGERLDLYLNDYGLALQRRGARETALDILQKAVDAGVADAETYRYLGRTFSDMNDYRQAESHLERALSLDPYDAAIYHDLATTYERQDRLGEAVDALVSGARTAVTPEEALHLLDLASDLRADDPSVLLARAELLASMGMLDQAYEALEASSASRPDDVNVLFSMADILRLRGQYQDAIAMADRVLAIEPGHVLALGTKGAALAALDQYADALQALDVALGISPDYVFGLGFKAEVLRLTGQFQDAVATAERALAVDPSHLLALGSKGASLAALGENDEALQVLNDALAIDPGYVAILSTKGSVLQAMGKQEEALEALDQVLSIAPGDPFALGIKGTILVGLGRPAEGIDLLRAAIELNPGWARLHATLAEALRIEGRLGEAISAADQALTLDPSNTLALGTKGASLVASDRLDDALETVEAALAIEPKYAFGLDVKARVLLTMGRTKEALEAADSALGVEPNNTFYLKTRAEILVDLAWYDEAIEMLKGALEADPNAVDLLTQLNLCLYMVGRHDEAIEAAERVRSIAPEDLGTTRRNVFSLMALRRIDEAAATLRRALEGREDHTLLADLGYVLAAADDYDGARQAIDRALQRVPDDPWVLSIHGQYLSNIAEYRSALEVLDRAIEMDPESSWALGMKGWALENLATEDRIEGRESDLASQCEEAYLAALAVDDTDLGSHAGLGDAFLLQGRSDEANEQFKWVTEQVGREAQTATADNLSVGGWCHYRLAEYSDAARLLIATLSLDQRMVSARFDLALVTAANKQDAVALREYRRAVQEARSRHPLGRRSVLLTALNDLREAVEVEGEEPPTPASTTPVRRSLLRVRKPPPRGHEEPGRMEEAVSLVRAALHEAMGQDRLEDTTKPT
jgi:tetratricopeptide (TPR) repeat protein